MLQAVPRKIIFDEKIDFLESSTFEIELNVKLLVFLKGAIFGGAQNLKNSLALRQKCT